MERGCVAYARPVVVACRARTHSGGPLAHARSLSVEVQSALVCEVRIPWLYCATTERFLNLSGGGGTKLWLNSKGESHREEEARAAGELCQHVVFSQTKRRLVAAIAVARWPRA